MAFLRRPVRRSIAFRRRLRQGLAEPELVENAQAVLVPRQCGAGSRRAAVFICSECGQAGAERVQHPQAAIVPFKRGVVRRRLAVRARRRQGLERQRPQGLGIAGGSRRAPAWGDNSRSASAAGGRDNFHQIPCRFNGKRVGILWNREAKGAGRASLAPLS